MNPKLTESSPELRTAELAQPFASPQISEVQQGANAEAKSLDLEDRYILLQRSELKNANKSELSEVETDEPWKVLPPRARMFQEAFCRPPFVVAEAAKETFDHAFISPRLFPDTLMGHLTGFKPTHSATSEQGMKQRYDKFGDLRAIFKNLEPICESKEDSGRISILPRKQGELQNVTTQNSWPRGAIIVSNNPRRKDGPKRHFSVYNNFYEFLRSLKHTLNNYSGRYNIKDLEKRPEFEVLNQLRADIRGSIDTLQNWKQLNPDQKVEVQLLIKELEGLLSRVRDEYKIKADDHLKDAESLQERKRKKYNPGSTCAKLVGGFNDVMSRFENCVGIERSVEKSLEKLTTTQGQIELGFTQIEVEIEKLLQDSYFSYSGFVDNPQIEKDALKLSEIVVAELDQLIEQAEVLIVNDSLPAPYPQWAEALLQNLKAAQILLKRMSQIEEEEHQEMSSVDIEDVYEAAVESTIMVNLTTRCINVQKGLANVINEILTRPWYLDPISCYHRVDDLHKQLDAHAFREAFDWKDEDGKILFKIPEVDALSSYCRDLKHRLKVWQKAKIKLKDRIKEQEGKYQPIPVEEYYEKLGLLEDQKVDLDVSMLNAIYEDVKALDFVPIFEALGKDRTVKAHRLLEKKKLYTVDGEHPAAGE